MPVPHYGSSGAVTRVGSGQTPTHFFIHSDSSLALITIHRKGQSQFCWSFRTNPTKQRAIFLKAPPPASIHSLPPLPSLPQSSSSCFSSPSPVSLFLPFLLLFLPLLLLSLFLPLASDWVEVTVKAGHKSKLKTGWEKKSAKKFQNGRAGAVSYLAQVGRKVPCSGLHTLFQEVLRGLRGHCGPGLSLTYRCSLLQHPGRSRAPHFPAFSLLGNTQKFILRPREWTNASWRASYHSVAVVGSFPTKHSVILNHKNQGLILTFIVMVVWSQKETGFGGGRDLGLKLGSTTYELYYVGMDD